MKKRVAGLLAAVMLLSGCSLQKRERPQWEKPLEYTRPGGQEAVVQSDAGAGPQAVAQRTILYEGMLSDQLKYVIYVDGEMELSGGNVTNKLLDESQLRGKWEKVETVTFGPGVEIIGRECASDLNMKWVTLGADVRQIEEYAFASCTQLRSVEFNTGLRSIGSYAFSGCTQLRHADLGAGIESLGMQIFDNCATLKTVSLDCNPSARSFEGCTAVTQVEFGPNVTQIGEFAFKGCTGLTELILPAGFQAIQSHAFEGCTSLSKVEFGEQIDSIGDYAFSGCSQLHSVTLGESISFLGVRIFDNCTALNSITLRCNPGTRSFEDCGSVTEVVFESGVSEIGSYAFKGCTSLQNLILPEGMEIIRERAFEGCTSLSKIEIPKSLRLLEKYVFSGDMEIQEVVFCDRTFGQFQPYGTAEWFDWCEGSSIREGICHKKK